MRSTNGNSVSWSWMRSADVRSNGKRNTAVVTPERLCVPRLLLRQHLTRPNHAASCVPVERHKARGRGEGDEEKQDKRVPP